MQILLPNLDEADTIAFAHLKPLWRSNPQSLLGYEIKHHRHILGAVDY